MHQKILKAIKDPRGAAYYVARRAFAAAALNTFTIPHYNYLFERSSWRLADLLIWLQTAPSFDMMWTVRLLNGRTVRVPVSADNRRSWEFAHAYHWHDVGIRDLEMSLFSRFLADCRNPIFFDIGANMGVRSLLPLSMGVYSVLFEPNPELRKFTEQVFALNHFSTYELHNICLSDSRGSAHFYVSADSYTSSLDRDWIAEGVAVNETVVETMRLDDWLMGRADLMGRAAVVKIDVEGAELAVLKGARDFIMESRPALILEVAADDVAPDAGHRKTVAEFCEQMDYRILVIRGGSKPVMEPVELNQFVAMSHESNFFAVHSKCDAKKFSQ